MAKNPRRVGGIVGMAVGALLAAPLIALLASPVASADTPDVIPTNPDITTTDYSFGGITDAYSSNSDTGGVDNLATFGGSDLDLFYGGSDTYGVVLTTGDLQIGFADDGGTFAPVLDLTPGDFIDPDIGFIAIGGF